MHDARKIANEFIKFGIENRRPLTPFEVGKLTYFAHAFMMVLCDEELIRNDQEIRAWKHGPVVAEVYFELKKWGRKGILNTIEDVDREKLSDKASNMIRAVFNNYGNRTMSELYDWTHKEGTPWRQIWDNGGEKLWDERKESAIIPNSLIKSYHKNLIGK